MGDDRREADAPAPEGRARARPPSADATRHQLEGGDERFRLLVESVRDYAIFMLDVEGRVRSWNVGAECTEGYRAEEILGQSFTCFHTPEDRVRGVPEDLLRRAAADGRAEAEGWRIRKDGSRFWADVVITALRDAAGQLTGYAEVTRDLSERVRLEAERLRTARSQEADRMRDDFLRIASHELRTPLTALQLDYETLAQVLGHAPPAVRRRLERAARSARRLGELVGRLLEVSRLSAGVELRLERFELGAAVRALASRLAAPAGLVSVSVTVEGDGPLDGEWDRSRVDQVLGILLGNAARHAPGAQVEIALRRDGDSALITVADRGPGFPEEVLAHLFERFTSSPLARQVGGLGLGLFMARQVVQSHGGSIRAANRAGGGATFTISLPLTRVPAAAPQASAASAG